MTIDRPSSGQLPALRQLWKQAFGDTDDFLDLFYRVGFSPDRCRCVTLDKLPVAALYWFDAFWEGRKLAYLYAIATDEAHRGKGLCKALMADTHRLLKELGYAGCLLVPAEGSLFDFYGSMGYRTVSTLREFTVQAGDTPVALTPIGSEEYAALRKKMLPSDSVLQEGDTLEEIASLNGTTAEQLLRLNPNLLPSDFTTGQVICLPARRRPIQGDETASTLEY